MDEYVIVEKSSLKSMADAVRTTTGNTENIAVSDLSNEVAAAIAGGGLPTGGAPYQQLVTDGDGNAKWEDRPFYTGDPVETVFVEESTVSFTENSGLYAAQFPSTFEAKDGETYKVSWDGTEYECTCASLQSISAIGNLSIIGAGSDTGEPFVMGIMNGEGIQIVTTNSSSSHTFSISGTDVPVVKIDKKYLVQPDLNQNDSTAADYVKNRTHYEESTRTDYVLNMNGTEIVGFSIPEVGGTITVEINGIESAETVKAARSGTFDNYTYIGNVDYDALRRGRNGWLVAAVSGGITVGFANPDTTITVESIIVHKIDEKYLPDNLATRSDVETAQTTADNAQTTADNAQTTAESNKKRLSELFESVAKFTFDKQTSGRDTFVFNAFNYYKISDFNPAPEDVISFKGTDGNGDNYSTINTGRNAMGYGLFIVVASAGRCSITFNNIHGEPVTMGFTAPSAGLYARYKENNSSQTAGTGQFILMSIDGLTIKSSTAGSTKKFKITVDDSGTISATEV